VRCSLARQRLDALNTAGSSFERGFVRESRVRQTANKGVVMTEFGQSQSFRPPVNQEEELEAVVAVAEKAAETGGGGPPEPPGHRAAAAWLAPELASAARKAREARNRAFTALYLLVVAAVVAVAAGLVVGEATFWTAASAVFAAALMAVVAYAAQELDVFAQTAELLGRRAGSEPTETVVEAEAKSIDLGKMRAKSAYDIGGELEDHPFDRTDDARRTSRLAALGAYTIASRGGHAESSRRCAQLVLELGAPRVRGVRSQAVGYLLTASRQGSTLAAYNLGAWHRKRTVLQRSEWERLRSGVQDGSGVHAFILGLLDPFEDAASADKLPWPSSAEVADELDRMVQKRSGTFKVR
jgi:hypothetical protein